MYFGLVDKSRGPRKKPPNSAINSAQDFSPLLFFAWRCSSSAWRTRSERERPSSLARLASQFANGAGNFSDIVFIITRYYRPGRLARSSRGESRHCRSAERISTFLFRLRDLCDLGGEKP